MSTYLALCDWFFLLWHLPLCLFLSATLLLWLAFMHILQCLDPLLHGRCSFFFTWSGRAKWRWSFYPFLLAENLSRFVYVIYYWKYGNLCEVFLCSFYSIDTAVWTVFLFALSLDEWTNFLERVDCKSEEELRRNEELEEELRLWASYRGQTLTRTGTTLKSGWRTSDSSNLANCTLSWFSYTALQDTQLHLTWF